MRADFFETRRRRGNIRDELIVYFRIIWRWFPRTNIAMVSQWSPPGLSKSDNLENGSDVKLRVSGRPGAAYALPRLKAPGVSPNSLRNCRMKWAQSAKPVRNATSVTVSSEFCSSQRA